MGAAAAGGGPPAAGAGPPGAGPGPRPPPPLHHDGFFGRLVAAVPARFYAEPGSGARPAPANPYAHTKSERALLKQRARQAHKAAKRRSLAPGAGGEGAAGAAEPEPEAPPRDRPATPSARIDLEGLVEAAAQQGGGGPP